MNAFSLEKLGLTQNESSLYLLLLKLGPSNAGMCIKKSGFQSSVVYHLLGRLQEKGVVSVVMQGTQKLYGAVDPTHFRTILDQQEQELAKTRQEFEAQLPSLLQLQKHNNPTSRIEIFEGKQGLKTVFNDILDSAKEYIVYGGTGNFTPLVPAYQKFFEQERLKRKIKQRNLFFGSRRDDAKYQTTKYLNSQNLPFSFVVYNDIVLINIFEQEPNITIRVTSKTLSQAYLQFFEHLFKQAS